jgi:imidazole glycerol-phosphate synthase subunit HisH
MSQRAVSLIDEPVEIAVLDYGMGNRRSVEKGFEHVGARASITREHEQLRAAAGLVVPGVGAFPRAMHNLSELGLDELLRERIAAGTPVLGICLGMQIAFDSSSEQGGAAGLGVVPGEVRALESAPAPSPERDGPAVDVEPGQLKLPHIGWNQVRFTQPRSPLVDDLPDSCAFYHVHSFAPVPADPQDVLGVAEYGAPFVTAVQRGSFYGVQFHPEKSSAAGLRLLANFARICIAVGAGHGADRATGDLPSAVR